MRNEVARISGLSKYDPLLRLNAICPYYTMFPLQFPLGVLGGAEVGDAVLDPFCGRGTTLYASRLLGLAACGVDANPIASALAAAKLAKAKPDSVADRCRELLQGGYEPKELPEGEFWRLCFAEQTLRDVCVLREQLLESGESDVDVLLRAVLLGVLHGPLRVKEPSYLSNQMPRTYASKPAYAIKYWRQQGLGPPQVDLMALVERRCRYSLDQVPPGVSGSVRFGDSQSEVRRFRRRFNWVVTSPPYYGMRTYLPDQWLRAWFLGAEPAVDYSTAGQLPQSSEDVFVSGLSAVWTAVSSRCEAEAKLVVRFGALPSKAKNPADLLLRSVQNAEAMWVVDDVLPAGIPPRGRRQAEQMVNKAGEYIEEVDLYATLRP